VKVAAVATTFLLPRTDEALHLRAVSLIGTLARRDVRTLEAGVLITRESIPQVWEWFSEAIALRTSLIHHTIHIRRCIDVRTNIVLDDELVEEAFKHSDARTKRELVDLALREFVENHRRKDIRELRGKISFHPGYDYKKLREGK
jgi:Arc/MetJ family transcription regulator